MLDRFLQIIGLQDKSDDQAIGRLRKLMEKREFRSPVDEEELRRAITALESRSAAPARRRDDPLPIQRPAETAYDPSRVETRPWPGGGAERPNVRIRRSELPMLPPLPAPPPAAPPRIEEGLRGVPLPVAAPPTARSSVAISIRKVRPGEAAVEPPKAAPAPAAPAAAESQGRAPASASGVGDVAPGGAAQRRNRAAASVSSTAKKVLKARTRGRAAAKPSLAPTPAPVAAAPLVALAAPALPAPRSARAAPPAADPTALPIAAPAAGEARPEPPSSRPERSARRPAATAAERRDAARGAHAALKESASSEARAAGRAQAAAEARRADEGAAGGRAKPSRRSSDAEPVPHPEPKLVPAALPIADAAPPLRPTARPRPLRALRDELPMSAGEVDGAAAEAPPERPLLPHAAAPATGAAGALPEPDELFGVPRLTAPSEVDRSAPTARGTELAADADVALGLAHRVRAALIAELRDGARQPDAADRPNDDRAPATGGRATAPLVPPDDRASIPKPAPAPELTPDPGREAAERPFSATAPDPAPGATPGAATDVAADPDPEAVPDPASPRPVVAEPSLRAALAPPRSGPLPLPFGFRIPLDSTSFKSAAVTMSFGARLGRDLVVPPATLSARPGTAVAAPASPGAIGDATSPAETTAAAFPAKSTMTVGPDVPRGLDAALGAEPADAPAPAPANSDPDAAAADGIDDDGLLDFVDWAEPDPGATPVEPVRADVDRQRLDLDLEDLFEAMSDADLFVIEAPGTDRIRALAGPDAVADPAAPGRSADTVSERSPHPQPERPGAGEGGQVATVDMGLDTDPAEPVALLFAIEPPPAEPPQAQPGPNSQSGPMIAAADHETAASLEVESPAVQVVKPDATEGEAEVDPAAARDGTAAAKPASDEGDHDAAASLAVEAVQAETEAVAPFDHDHVAPALDLADGPDESAAAARPMPSTDLTAELPFAVETEAERTPGSPTEADAVAAPRPESVPDIAATAESDPFAPAADPSAPTMDPDDAVVAEHAAGEPHAGHSNDEPIPSHRSADEEHAPAAVAEAVDTDGRADGDPLRHPDPTGGAPVDNHVVALFGPAMANAPSPQTIKISVEALEALTRSALEAAFWDDPADAFPDPQARADEPDDGHVVLPFPAADAVPDAAPQAAGASSTDDHEVDHPADRQAADGRSSEESDAAQGLSVPLDPADPAAAGEIAVPADDPIAALLKISRADLAAKASRARDDLETGSPDADGAPGVQATDEVAGEAAAAAIDEGEAGAAEDLDAGVPDHASIDAPAGDVIAAAEQDDVAADDLVASGQRDEPTDLQVGDTTDAAERDDLAVGSGGEDAAPRLPAPDEAVLEDATGVTLEPAADDQKASLPHVLVTDAPAGDATDADEHDDRSAGPSDDDVAETALDAVDEGDEFDPGAPFVDAMDARSGVATDPTRDGVGEGASEDDGAAPAQVPAEGAGELAEGARIAGLMDLAERDRTDVVGIEAEVTDAPDAEAAASGEVAMDAAFAAAETAAVVEAEADLPGAPEFETVAEDEDVDDAVQPVLSLEDGAEPAMLRLTDVDDRLVEAEPPVSPPADDHAAPEDEAVVPPVEVEERSAEEADHGPRGDADPHGRSTETPADTDAHAEAEGATSHDHTVMAAAEVEDRGEATPADPTEPAALAPDFETDEAVDPREGSSSGADEAQAEPAADLSIDAPDGEADPDADILDSPAWEGPAGLTVSLAASEEAPPADMVDAGDDLDPPASLDVSPEPSPDAPDAGHADAPSALDSPVGEGVAQESSTETSDAEDREIAEVADLPTTDGVPPEPSADAEMAAADPVVDDRDESDDHEGPASAVAVDAVDVPAEAVDTVLDALDVPDAGDADARAALDRPVGEGFAQESTTENPDAEDLEVGAVADLPATDGVPPEPSADAEMAAADLVVDDRDESDDHEGPASAVVADDFDVPAEAVDAFVDASGASSLDAARAAPDETEPAVVTEPAAETEPAVLAEPPPPEPAAVAEPPPAAPPASPPAASVKSKASAGFAVPAYRKVEAQRAAAAEGRPSRAARGPIGVAVATRAKPAAAVAAVPAGPLAPSSDPRAEVGDVAAAPTAATAPRDAASVASETLPVPALPTDTLPAPAATPAAAPAPAITPEAEAGALSPASAAESAGDEADEPAEPKPIIRRLSGYTLPERTQYVAMDRSALLQAGKKWDAEPSRNVPLMHASAVTRQRPEAPPEPPPPENPRPTPPRLTGLRRRS
jgi:hypothetical protein